MNPDSHLSPPLSRNQFYALLALCRGELHGYSLHAVAFNDSLGGLSMSPGHFYTLIKGMVRDGLIAEAGPGEVGKHGKPRTLYRITPEGRVRLKDDLRRMKHAYDIGERAGLFFEDLPSDIQRILNAVR